MVLILDGYSSHAAQVLFENDFKFVTVVTQQVRTYDLMIRTMRLRYMLDMNRVYKQKGRLKLVLCADSATELQGWVNTLTSTLHAIHVSNLFIILCVQEVVTHFIQ